MLDDKTFTLAEAHKHFAIKTNGEAWHLLEKPDRDSSDNELLLHLAHTSYYHWLQVGTGLHHQRAEWLLSHVYAEVGMAGISHPFDVSIFQNSSIINRRSTFLT